MSIDAAQLGTVVKDAELRTSAAGKPWMSVIVRSGDGDAASFVQVAIFGDAAVALNAYARAAEAAIRRAEEERETERTRSYWEERQRDRER